jgi:hypothetical protein
MFKKILSTLLVLFALSPIFGFKGYIQDILFISPRYSLSHNNPDVAISSYFSGYAEYGWYITVYITMI